MRHKYKKSSFSLIEILTVLVISSIIIGIALPSMNSLMKGQSVEQATSTLGSTFKALRSYAITHRKYVALIIPIDITGYETLPAEYLNKSFKPCVVTNNNGTYTFAYWISNEKWEFLPSSSAILDIDDNSQYDEGNFSAATDVSGVDYSSVDSSKTSCTAKAIIIKPTGKTAGSRKFIVVGNSNILNGVAIDTDNQIDIVIDQYTGRISYGSD